MSKEFNVTTDASNTAIGAILSQGEIGHDRPCIYASRCLNAAEQNYSTTEKELLAAVWAIRQFRHYLYGRSFKLITDHQPLRGLFKSKNTDVSSRIFKLLTKVTDYEPNIIYKKGKLNSNADALSRMYIETQNASSDQAQGVDQVVTLLEGENSEAGSTERRKTLLERTLEKISERKSTKFVNVDAEDTYARYRQSPSVYNPRVVQGKRKDDDAYVHLPRVNNNRELWDALLEAVSRDDDPFPLTLSVQDDDMREEAVEMLHWLHDNLDLRREYNILISNKNKHSRGKLEIVRCCEGDLIITAKDFLGVADLENLKQKLEGVLSQQSRDQEEVIELRDFDENTWKLLKEISEEWCSNHTQVRKLKDFLPKHVERESKKLQLIMEAHGRSHWSPDKVYQTIKARYCWKDMKSQIDKLLTECEECETKEILRKFRAPGSVVPAPTRINEQWYMDHAGPYGAKREYLLFLVEGISRFVKVIKQKDLKNTIVVLEKHFLTFGRPNKIVSDNHAVFNQIAFGNLMEKYNIEHIKTTPLHPQSNGIVERCIGTLKKKIIRHVERNAETGVQEIVYEYNHTIHSTTGRTPYYLFFGRAERKDQEKPRLEEERRIHEAEIEQAVERINNKKTRKR